MSWQWRATAGKGDEPTPVGQEFGSQQVAEQWLTASYEDLVDDGYDKVWLYENERLVYGPMPLSA